MKTLTGTTITVMVSNMDQGIQFYTDTLGLSLVQRYGDHYAEIDAAGVKIGLHPSSEKISYGDNLSIGFGVSDFDAALADLQANGIEVSVNEEGWGRIGGFADPDGNGLYIAEIKD